MIWLFRKIRAKWQHFFFLRYQNQKQRYYDLVEDFEIMADSDLQFIINQASSRLQRRNQKTKFTSPLN
jgi:hypothetical protein